MNESIVTTVRSRCSFTTDLPLFRVNVRIPISSDSLSQDKRNLIIKELASTKNIPVFVSPSIHKKIEFLLEQVSIYARPKHPDVCLTTTSDNVSYVDILISFRTEMDLNGFFEATELT